MSFCRQTPPDIYTSCISVCAACVGVRGASVCASVVPAGRQVDEGEDVVLDEAGEAQEDRVEEETREAQTLVQRPLVEVNAQNLVGAKREGGEVSGPVRRENKCPTKSPEP